MIRRLLVVLVALGPPVFLALAGYQALLRRVDGHLSRATPIVTHMASDILQRPVSVGRVRVGDQPLSVARIRELLTHPESFASLPVTVENLTLGLKPDEALLGSLLARPPAALARVGRATLIVSVPALLGGRATQEGIARITLEKPEALLVRLKDGSFPIQDILPKTAPPDYKKPPFKTLILVKDGRLRFLDLAAKNGERVSDNSLENLQGYADLLGARQLRYSLTGQADRNTLTARRVTGSLAASGSASRGPPGFRPDSPDPASPRFTVALDATGAEASYWLPYFLPLEALEINAGRADVRFTSVGPRGANFEGPHPPPILQARARFDGGAFTAKALPKLSLTGWHGNLVFDDDRLALSGEGLALGAPASVRGTIFSLRKDLGQTSPTIDATVDAPQVPLTQALELLNVSVPKGLALPDRLALTGVSLNGPLTRPRASGQLAAPMLRFTGWPEARGVTARFALVGDVLQLDAISAQVAGGGRITGKVLARPKDKQLYLAGRAEGVPLRSLTQVQKLKKPWTLSGNASAEFLGEVRGAGYKISANVVGQELKAAGIPLTYAGGRLELDNAGARLDAVKVTSKQGDLVGGGTVTKDGTLGLVFDASGIDAGWLAKTLGTAGVSGQLSGKLAIAGTPTAPTFVAQDALGLNVRWRVDGHSFAADTARCARATISLDKDSIVFDEPLKLRRFPASATVRGSLGALRSKSPTLALTAEASDLDLDELLGQLQPGPKKPGKPFLLATITGGKARVGGTVNAPVIDGAAQVGQVLVGPYPVESGRAEFHYEKKELSVKKATLLASIGELDGHLRIGPTGILTGSFEAPELNLEALSFLTEKYASLAGKASASLTLVGTAQKPGVVMNIRPGSFAEVAGTHLTDLNGTVRLDADLEKETVRFRAPKLAFRQAGALVSLTEGTLDPLGQKFSLAAKIADGQLETVLTTLRRSRLDETEAGQAFIDALNQLPAPLDGRFTLQGNLAGRFLEGILAESVGAATLTASDVTLGPAAIKNIEAAATITGRNISVSKLVLTRDEATVDLPRPGKLTLPAKKGDPLAFDVTFDSPETNLDLVRAFLPRFTLLGKVGLTVRLFGDTKAPRVTASLEGQNLAIALGEEREFLLSRLSFIVNAQRGADGRGTLQIDSGRIEHAVLDPKDPSKVVREDAVSFDALVPLETIRSETKKQEEIRLARTGPINVKASIDSLGLDTLSAALGGKVRASGTLSGTVSAGGTLEKPALGGQLALDARAVTLPRDALGGDVLNPINAARLALALDGDTVRVTEGQLSLQAPSKKQEKESFGSVALTGSVRLDNLAELPALLSEDPDAAIARVAGEYDLTATFNGLRPVARNISALLLAEAPLGLGEAVTGRLTGKVKISGKKLLAPHVASEPGNALTLSQALLLLPVREGPPPSKVKEVPLFNPTFDVTVSIPTDATVANQSRLFFFDFKSQGELHIGGDAYQPEVLAELVPTGGKIRYPLAPPFRVKRQGSLELTYGTRTPRLSVKDIEAEGTVSVRPGSTALGAGRIRDSGSFLTSVGTTTESARYKITLALDGPLDVFGVGSSDPGSFLRAGSGLRATSDPPLPGGTEAILRILGADDQLRQLASGDAQGALLSTLEQVSSNVFLTGLLDPFNQFIVDAFGLRDFNINYFPDGTAIVQASVGFHAPLERFSANLTRTIQTRASQNQRIPTLLSLTYDLNRFAKKSRYTPRLQLGVSNDEQRLVRYFLKGTISY